MTPEELMKPRRKVKLKYPNSPFDIGDILYKKYNDSWFWVQDAIEGKDQSAIHENWVADCPDIFEKVEWWEERHKDDLPRYIRFYEPLPEKFKIGKISKWEIGKNCIVTTDADISRRELSVADLPSTEEEYNTYKQSQP